LSRRKFAFEVSKSKIEPGDFSPVSGKSGTSWKKGLIALGTHKIGLEEDGGGQGHALHGKRGDHFL